MGTTIMTAINGNYADILEKCKILYVPSCLIIEMMTKFYSRISMLNVSSDMRDVAPPLLVLLKRLTHNLKVTADAYKHERIRFFIGDWKIDKLRARTLFSNLKARLDHISEFLSGAEKNLVFRSIREMAFQWAVLDGVMQEKCDENNCGANFRLCRYFRSESESNWQNVMAKILLDLDDCTEYPDDDTYLILLCYERIGRSFVRAIETLRERNAVDKRFSPSRIICVSNEELGITCPKCGRMTDSAGSGDTEVIARDEKAQSPTERREKTTARISLRGTVLRGRYPMPPSLAGVVW